MAKFLSNGGLSKMLWIILCFMVGLGSLIVFMVEVIQGQTINPYVASILSGIIAHAFTIGGSVNTSSQLEKGNDALASQALSAATLHNQSI